jgi:hypothetical protein
LRLLLHLVPPAAVASRANIKVRQAPRAGDTWKSDALHGTVSGRQPRAAG